REAAGGAALRAAGRLAATREEPAPASLLTTRPVLLPAEALPGEEAPHASEPRAGDGCAAVSAARAGVPGAAANSAGSFSTLTSAPVSIGSHWIASGLEGRVSEDCSSHRSLPGRSVARPGLCAPPS